MKQIFVWNGSTSRTGGKAKDRFSSASRLCLRMAVMCMLALFCALPAAAQEITVSGTITDTTGEPLIGAAVFQKGTTNGCNTDLDGHYQVKVPSDAILMVSYVGYQPSETKVEGRTHIDIVLSEDSELLEEVVVVGYGTVKRSDLTGAVSSVDTKSLVAKGNTNVIGALQGSTPGVNITQSSGRANGGFDIEIRGKSSINSNTTPLYIVDGVMCNDIDFLNPQDIERIDVLKDASSTAIYGSRATAGVIMITTKGGVNVNREQKASITYDGFYGINHVARTPDFMDGSEFYRYRFQKFVAPVNGGTFTSAQPTYGAGGLSNFGQALLAYNSADLSQGFALKDMLANGQTYDWPSLVTQNGHQQNHYVAVSGASETVNYHFGLGFNGVEGIYKGDKNETFSFKGSVDAKINSVIQAGFTFNLARMENQYAYDTAISQAYRMNPYMQPYDADGNVLRYPGNKTTLGTDGNQFSDSVNPLYLMNDYKHKRTTYRALGNAYLQLNLMKGLNVKTTFSPSYTNYRDGEFTGYIDPNTGYTYGGNNPETSDAYNTATALNYTGFGWTWDNTINYNATFNRVHNVSFLGLFSMEKSHTEKFQTQGNNVMNDTDWFNMGSAGTIVNDGSTYSSYSESSMISYAVRLNYDFMGKYYFTGTVRWDGSSKFADGHRWGSFPSAALAWRVSEENFMKNITWINNLKLRVSYGVTGNNKGIGNYDTIVGISGPVNYPFGPTYVNGYYPSGIVNADLSWEKSHEWNVGLDFGFLNSRINGSIEYYQKKSKDLLYDVDLPLETGGGTMATNIGSVRNRGVELSLTTINVTNRNFEWSTTLTLAHNQNKVLEINGASDQVLNKSNCTGNLFVGYSTNNVYSYVWDGVVSDKMMTVPNHQIAIEKGFTPGSKVVSADYYYACYGLSEGQPIIRDVNGDGVWDADNDRVITNSDPKVTGSFTSNMSYKLPKKGGVLDFSFNIYARLGGKVFSPFMGDRSYSGSYYCTYNDRGLNKLMRDFYIPTGALLNADGMNSDGILVNPTYQTTTHYGKYPFVNSGTSNGLGKAEQYYMGYAQGITNADYAKVKYITLGYTFDKSILNYIGCKSARIYFTVTNPFVFTKYKGFDPEWMTAALKNDGPSTISYQIGANIKF